VRAITMKDFGDPDVLQLEEVVDPEPRGPQIVVNVTRAGVNYADIHVRGNTYLAPVDLPYTPGNEVVGTTADGRRVVALTRGGGYAEKALVHRRLNWEVPDGVSDEQAVPLALQGNTAWHLLFTVCQIKKGQKIVIPAAAGGVGSIAVQLAREAGAQVIALASTEEKRQLALDLGAHTAIDSIENDLTERIKEAAGGAVHAALEMTGGATLHQTVAALAPRGRLACYGFASGQLTDVSIHHLLENSLTVSGFWLPHLYTDREVSLEFSMKGLFAAVANGTLRTITGGTYALGEAAQAHRDLASRQTTGKLSLDTSK
jgi:NADPH2:quinone reductase